MSIDNSNCNKFKRPDWIRIKSPGSNDFSETLQIIRSNNVHTVCEEALCPNICECWKKKTATFLIMGDICTRKCGFCGVKTGFPNQLDSLEPINVAKTIMELGIEYAIITSVTRDDLPDGGAQHFADVVCAIKKTSPSVKIEILTSDFQGSVESIETVVKSSPDVFGHNIEIVRSLHKAVKKQPADYDVSLNFLIDIKKYSKNIVTKTGLIVGAGENKEEVFQTIVDLVNAKVDILTIGQYLSPTKNHCSVVRYVTPDEFEEYKTFGEKMGITAVFAGPLVRSSYKANEIFSSIKKIRT